jgi:ketosteroid isomerase-like protein
MPAESVEVISRLIDASFAFVTTASTAAPTAWNQRDLQAALEEMHPQCQVRPAEATQTLRGHDGVATAFRDWFDAFDEFTLEPEDFIVKGDRVIVPVKQRARGRGSGLEVEERFYQLFILRDGKVFRFEEYSQEAEARKAFDN